MSRRSFVCMTKIWFLFPLLLAVHAVFHVEKSGILPVKKKDVIIEFYLAIANDVRQEVTVTVKKEPRCCWEVTKGDKDCESMVLYGKGKLNISPGKVQNMTYLFPNKTSLSARPKRQGLPMSTELKEYHISYPLNRLGHCTFELESERVHRKHKVNFNTREDLAGSWIPGFGYSGKVKTCPTVDKDPYNNCAPVDCAHKYNGKRSFYNTKRGRCEKAAWCNTKRDGDNLPISAFDKDNNRCKSLIIGSLKESERKMMKKDSEEALKLSGLGSMFEAVSDPSKIDLDCNHGKQEGTTCFCDVGWTSVRKMVEKGRTEMEWCNKKISPLGSGFFPYYISVLTILGIVAIMSLSLLLYLGWVFLVKTVGYSPVSSLEALIKSNEDSDSGDESDEVYN